MLNEYLQRLMEQVSACVQGGPESTQGCRKDLPGIKLKPCYKPFSWLPHSTMGKKLTPEQLTDAFRVLQKEFKVQDDVILAYNGGKGAVMNGTVKPVTYNYLRKVQNNLFLLKDGE